MNKREFTPEECEALEKQCHEAIQLLGRANNLLAQRTQELQSVSALAKAQDDCIVKCREEILRLREENRWIPVEERLPDKDGVYEVWKNVKHPHLGQQFDKAQFYNGSWHGNGGRWANVTHWKPMPKGPEV